ncbi:2Fe-2S iron-sulfur cluster-binding protein [Pseudomonas sp. BF-R-19]|uniref:2Fe-2S iron-sulfur cluster-binding protein n=1 Tax=Pseudomonas sp. BF-R-19 TaxID=2832397 RepID=UPI001CBB3E59|nr:2Fe-2S iron-sulfur cluster-binding protein [Pseudomonas sp. BF-R-19]
MPKITFVEHSGEQHILEGKPGQSVMQLAVENMIPGILADCGGYANCATCHCYVEAPWSDRLPAPDEPERDMLTCAIDQKQTSRLSCQIQIVDELDGLVVLLPRSQT